jgi:hypothetical protein
MVHHTDPDAPIRFPDTTVEPQFFDGVDDDDNLAVQGDDFSTALVEEAEEFDLEDLLATSMKVVREGAKVKEARKALAYGGMNAEERAVIEAAVRKYELEREWTAEANVLMFNSQYCSGCGCVHSHLVGKFQRQSHRLNSISRWVVALADSNLPNEVKQNLETVDICVNCMDTHGWENQDEPK